MNILTGKANIETGLVSAIASYKKGKKEIGEIVASILVHCSEHGDISMLDNVFNALTKRDNTHLVKFLGAFTPVKIVDDKCKAKGWNDPANWNMDVVRSNFMDWSAGKPETPLKKPTKAVEALEKTFDKWNDADGDALEIRMALLMLEKLTRKLTGTDAGDVVEGEVVETNAAATAVH